MTKRIAAAGLLLLLSCGAGGEVQVAGGWAMVGDAPAFRILLGGLTVSKDENPLLLTRTAGQGALSLHRIPVGSALPYGSAPIEAQMAQDTVAKVLLENIQNSTGGRILSVGNTALAGAAAMRIEYQFAVGRAARRGVAYGMFSRQTFFLVQFSAPEDAGLRGAFGEFERAARSLQLL